MLHLSDALLPVSLLSYRHLFYILDFFVVSVYNIITLENTTEEQVAEIKAAKEKLMESAQKLFTKMYEQAGAAAGAQAGPTPEAGPALLLCSPEQILQGYLSVPERQPLQLPSL